MIVRINPDRILSIVRINTDKAIPLLVAAPAFPGRLRRQMKAREVGVRSLAEKSGLDKGTISLWRTWDKKKGRSGKAISVRVDKVQRIAGHLDTTAEYLLGLQDSGQRSGPADDQRALLRRIAAMKEAIAEVDDPTQELARALAGSQKDLGRLMPLLAELMSIADEAGGAQDP